MALGSPVGMLLDVDVGAMPVGTGVLVGWTRIVVGSQVLLDAGGAEMLLRLVGGRGVVEFISVPLPVLVGGGTRVEDVGGSVVGGGVTTDVGGVVSVPLVVVVAMPVPVGILVGTLVGMLVGTLVGILVGMLVNRVLVGGTPVPDAVPVGVGLEPSVMFVVGFGISVDEGTPVFVMGIDSEMLRIGLDEADVADEGFSTPVPVPVGFAVRVADDEPVPVGIVKVGMDKVGMLNVGLVEVGVGSLDLVSVELGSVEFLDGVGALTVCESLVVVESVGLTMLEMSLPMLLRNEPRGSEGWTVEAPVGHKTIWELVESVAGSKADDEPDGPPSLVVSASLLADFEVDSVPDSDSVSELDPDFVEFLASDPADEPSERVGDPKPNFFDVAVDSDGGGTTMVLAITTVVTGGEESSFDSLEELEVPPKASESDVSLFVVAGAVPPSEVCLAGG